MRARCAGDDVPLIRSPHNNAQPSLPAAGTLGCLDPACSGGWVLGLVLFGALVGVHGCSLMFGGNGATATACTDSNAKGKRNGSDEVAVVEQHREAHPKRPHRVPWPRARGARAGRESSVACSEHSLQHLRVWLGGGGARWPSSCITSELREQLWILDKPHKLTRSAHKLGACDQVSWAARVAGGRPQTSSGARFAGSSSRTSPRRTRFRSGISSARGSGR